MKKLFLFLFLLLLLSVASFGDLTESERSYLENHTKMFIGYQSNGTLEDWTGNCSITNAGVTSRTGIISGYNAMDFDNDEISTCGVPTSDVSYVIPYYIDTYPSTTTGLATTIASSTNRDGLIIYTNNPDGGSVRAYNADSLTMNTQSGENIAVGNWYQSLVTITTNAGVLYANGSDHALAGQYNSNDVNLNIGNYYADGTLYFDGAIQYVAVFDVELNQTYIDHFNTTSYNTSHVFPYNEPGPAEVNLSFIAKNVYDNSAIGNFSVSIDGVNYNTTTGTITTHLLSNDTSSYDYNFTSSTYYNQSGSVNASASSSEEVETYQAVLNLNAIEIVTGAKVQNPTFNASAQSSNNTLLVDAGNISVTFSKSGFYSFTRIFDTTPSLSNQTLNFSDVHNSKINLTALGFPGSTSISNFTYFVTQGNYSYAINGTIDGTEVLINLTSGLNYTINVSKSNFFGNSTEYALNDTLANLSLNLLSRVKAFLYFYDENTLAAINGVEFEVLSDSFSLRDTSGADNAFFLSALPGTDYEVRYLINSTDYSPRSYFLRVPLTSPAFANISLYGVWENISSTFIRTIVDQNSAPLENGLLEVQRAYPSDDNSSLIYRTVEIAEIDNSGDAVFRAIPNTQAYRFRILKNFSLLETRSPSYLIDSSSEFLVNEEAELLDNFKTFGDISSSLIFQNTTDYFILDYTDAGSSVSEVCLRVSRSYGATFSSEESCLSTTSGTIMVEINSSLDGVYNADAFATIDNTDYPINAESVTLPIPNTQSIFLVVSGVLLLMILIMCATLTGFINPVFPIVLAVVAIGAFSLNFLGLFHFGTLILGGLLVGGGVILYLVGKS